MAKKISICIIAKNEEDIIEECLRQARKLADELVLVDSGSTDKTLEIAAKYCDKIEHHDWQGYSKQKNYALSLCSNEWALSLDADEVMPDALIDEIKSLAFDKSGYRVARKLYIGKRFIRYGGFFPDYQMRLFKKNIARFKSASVHESIELKDQFSGKYTKDFSKMGSDLKTPLDHFSYDNLAEMEKAFDNFASLFNGSLPKEKKGLVKAISKSIYTFIYKFFFRMGFLDGMLGLKLAIINMVYTYNKYLPSSKDH